MKKDPKFSIILPTYLGEYKGAASNREEKLVRAINSVYAQTFKDFELIVVCDGCQKSFDIVTEKFKEAAVYLIDKQQIWSGNVRNVGIEEATGENIVYIDNDDVWGVEHLEMISKQIKGAEWAFFNDYILKGNSWIERPCSISLGHCGTSNVCHKREHSPRWGGGYAHDYYFIKNLERIAEPKIIRTPAYFVCHIPKMYDV